MSGGKDRVLDIRYGRQGGRRTSHVTPTTVRPCSECGRPMILGQPGRHWICSPICAECHRPYGPDGQNCECAGGPTLSDIQTLVERS